MVARSAVQRARHDGDLVRAGRVEPAQRRAGARPRSDRAVRGADLRFIRVLLGPIADRLVALGNRVTPGRRATAVSFSSEEQLLSMVDEATELEVLEEDDRELIHSIFEFNDTVVREVMVPRTDMITVDDDDEGRGGDGPVPAAGASRACR